MTTSAVRPSSNFAREASRAGFTLLEMVIALSLVALMVGIGAISYANSGEERILRETASEIEAMASRGHAMSVLHQKPFWLRIEEGKILLIGADVEKKPVGEEAEWEDSHEESETSEVIYDDYSTPATIMVRRWGAGDDEWDVPEKDEFLTWQFQATGLCEPLSIKIEQAGNWLILHMHPLTARVEEEEMNIE